MELGIYILCAALGLAIGWLLGNQRSKERLARVEAQLEAQVEAMARGSEHFESLAGDVLRQSSEQLLILAEQRFKTAHSEGEKALETRKQAVEQMVKPIRESLDKMQKSTVEMEKERSGAYQALRTQVKELQTETRSLRESSTKLSTALRGSSQARGRWGQLALENIAQMAGMSAHCDFDVEVSLKSGKDGARVDLLAHLPGGGQLPVDAKVPLAAYWDALDESDPTIRTAGMVAHARALKAHVDEMARRNYSSLLDEGVDFTVLFIPADPILAAAFEHAPDLQEYAFERRILVATPVTLIALLRTVGIYWQQQTLAENAREIFDLSKDFYNRTAKFAEDLSKVGKGLGTAVKAYNTAVGSFDRRVMPAGRRLETLKLADNAPRKLDPGTPVEAAVREIDAAMPEPELPLDPS